PWLMLLDAFRVSVAPPMLILASIGALLGAIGWQLADGIFVSEQLKSEVASLKVDADYFGAFPGERTIGNCPVGCYEYPPGKQVAALAGPWPDDPMIAVPYRIVRPYMQLVRTQSWGEFGYYLFGAVWTLAVWGLVGCALTRIAAVRFAHDEHVDFLSALSVGSKRFLQHMAAVWMPIAGVVILAMPLALLGFLMRWNPLAALGGLIWIAVIPVAIVMALFVLGWLFSWPLMWGSLSAEGQDSFDAVSRSYAYLFQQPHRYAFYVLIAAIVGFMGWLSVWFVSELVVHLGVWGVRVGLGTEQMNELMSAASGEAVSSSLVRFGGRCIGFWQGVVRTISSAYAYSYFWTAVAGVYLLMRYDVDSVELDELFNHENGHTGFDIAELLAREE
ncbi:MAG: hypothetical protein AAF497_15800, partial [Planctomycetota bacterium]